MWYNDETFNTVTKSKNIKLVRLKEIDMKNKNATGIWIAIGTGIGVALGVAVHNIGVGICLGIGIGSAICAGINMIKKCNEANLK